MSSLLAYRIVRSVGTSSSCQIFPERSFRPYPLRTARQLQKRTMSFQISGGKNIEEVQAGVEKLQQEKWILNADQALEKTYYLSSYAQVLELHQTIGKESDARNHHPEMNSFYGGLKVAWKTHRPLGLSLRDTRLASFCDQEAEKLDTLDASDARKC
ncbi:hypothetical protein ACN47E_005817 [Coniothyrium glycines]